MNHVWKSRLLAGATACAVCLVLSTTALAQTPAAPAKPPAPAVSSITNADQLMGNESFYIEADTVVRDDENHLWTAKGSVEARYQGRTLRADEVVYNSVNGVVTARGDVQLINLDGSVEFAKAMTVDKDFKTGIALAFSTRQKPNAKLIADEAVRLNQDAMELNKAVFTVCDICAPDGTPEEPTWSIQAEQVIQDHKRQIVFYKHVVIRIKGHPVVKLPVFWHVDPTAKRGSGLLAPKIALDSRRGFSYEQPYLFVISPSQDIVIAPQINTKVYPFLEGEYRKRFYSGEVDARFGITDDAMFDGSGRKYGDISARSYILAQGAFAPTEHWTYGFSAERVTDPLLFNRYAIPNVYDQRGLYSADDQRLLSQVYAVEQSSGSYVSVAAMSFQGLRPGDNNGTFPLVAPLVEAHFEPPGQVLGGRLRLDGGGVLLSRDRNIVTDTAPGMDSRRGTIGGDWRGAYTLADGIRLEPFANARTDLYNVDDISALNTGMHTTSRVLATAGMDLSWPFFRREGDSTLVLEPLAQIAISPRTTVNPLIPNEDSTVFSFDETTLFDANKSPGFDYYEGGARINVGGRATVRWDDGGSAQLMAERSYRTRVDPTLPAGTSLNQTASDWILAATAQPAAAFSGFTRARIDGSTGRVNTMEVGVNGFSPRANGFIRYLYDSVDLPGQKMQNAQVGGQFLITNRWGLTASANYDIAAHVPVLEEFGLLYQDECTHWELVYQHDGTYNRTLHPSDKIILRLMLVTLGGTGYQRPDFR